jgi:hypothetical protein
VLHARARLVPATLVGAAGVALVGWVAATWLVERNPASDPLARLPVIVAVPLVIAVLVSIGLDGADQELERSTAVRWWLLRLGHLLAAAAVVAPIATIGLWQPRHHGAYELVRNGLGSLGLVATATVLIGARLAWAPTMAYVLFVFSWAADRVEIEPTGATGWLTWPVQPADVSQATWAALVLFVVGVALFTVRGARRTRLD